MSLNFFKLKMISLVQFLIFQDQTTSDFQSWVKLILFIALKYFFVQNPTMVQYLNFEDTYFACLESFKVQTVLDLFDGVIFFSLRFIF